MQMNTAASCKTAFGDIYADPDLPHRARTVYMYLRDRAGGGSCWPGVKTIARDLHLSPRTVQRALNDLERAGYIQRQRRHRENDREFFLFVPAGNNFEYTI